MKQYLIADHAATLFIWGLVGGFLLAVFAALYIGNRIMATLEADTRHTANLDSLLARPRFPIRDADIVIDR